MSARERRLFPQPSRMAPMPGGARRKGRQEVVRMATQVITPYTATGHTRAREAMARTICTARKSDSVEKVARMMKDEDCGFVPITDDGRVIGVITCLLYTSDAADE